MAPQNPKKRRGGITKFHAGSAIAGSHPEHHNEWEWHRGRRKWRRGRARSRGGPQPNRKRRGGITSLVDNTMGDGYGGCTSCTTSMDCPPMTQCMGGSSPFGGCCVGRGPSGGPQPPKKRRGGRF